MDTAACLREWDMVQPILHELLHGDAVRLLRRDFYLAYVLAHDIAHVVSEGLRACNVTLPATG